MPRQARTSSVHPSAVIGPGVELGRGVSIGPFVCLTGPMVVGDGVVISAGATLGGPAEVTGVPQGPDHVPEECGVVLERDVVIRESVVIHRGTHRETRVGAGSWVLNRSYLAHDVVLGRDCVVSAGASLGGHCTIGDLVTIGMNAAVHQRRRIGRGSIIGMGAVVTHDVPPWAKVHGVPARLRGANVVGMRRAGLGEESVVTLDENYRCGRYDLSDAPAEIDADLSWWHALADRRPAPRAEWHG